MHSGDLRNAVVKPPASATGKRKLPASVENAAPIRHPVRFKR
jgi:hypothetical protein